MSKDPQNSPKISVQNTNILAGGESQKAPAR